MDLIELKYLELGKKPPKKEPKKPEKKNAGKSGKKTKS